MSKVRKAIIPAAGLGTRFLPATKSTPKEMLPIVDRPIILYVIEEAVRAGIEDIIIIAGRGKHAIEDFFDRSYELEDLLEKGGKTDLLEQIKRVRNLANIISIRQKEALGLGHAVLCGQPIVGKESFAVLLGDEIMVSKDNEPTVTTQLTEVYNDTGLSTVAVMEVEPSEVSKYGIVATQPAANGRYKVTDVVEKPKASDAPSRLALPGRYVFTGRLFDYLKDTKPGKNGEIQLTDGMTSLAKNEGLLATQFKARRYDAGDKLGYLIANLDLGLENPELREGLKSHLKKLVKQW
jgi:UTP--glucose-1-phosphate uridylyltransferase